MEGVVQQAIDRDHKHVRDIESYLSLRRKTIGTKPSYGLIDLHFNIPDYMVQHPHVEHMSDLATDMISMCNDMYSYNKEQATGEADHNLITVVMRQLGVSLEEAYAWVAAYHDDVMEEFLDLYETLPWFPDEPESTNQELREYVYGLGDWVRANERWSFEVCLFGSLFSWLCFFRVSELTLDSVNRAEDTLVTWAWLSSIPV